MRRVEPTPDALAEAVAHALLGHLSRRLAQGRDVHLCLTGGGIALATYRQIRFLTPRRREMSGLHLWWGDERFVAADSDDRNDRAALTELTRAWDLDADHLHPMPSSDDVATPDDAAAQYAEELGGTLFDVCLLGVGSDGHVASLFPDHASFAPTDESVIGVVDAPKPPPERVSLTTAALNRSRQVWIIAAGQEKAAAIRRGEARDRSLPIGQARGSQRTAWWLDEAAANGPA